MGIRTVVRRWSAYQQTVRELNALDNRSLADLGIKRGDIPTIAREYADAALTGCAAPAGFNSPANRTRMKSETNM